MNGLSFNIIAGLILLAVGLVLPSSALVQGLRGSGAVGEPALVQGAWLFKAGLVTFGAYLLALRLLPVRQPPVHIRPEISEASPVQTAIFIALLVCATALRLHDLDVGIWYDEMLTSVYYMPMTVGQIVSTYHDANNHVLFSVLARLSLSVFGDSVWAFRLPAVLFGIGGVAALYYLARRVSGTNESLFAAALLTFSYHHIWFSQNARGYTALLFFSILSSAWLLDAIRHGSPRKWGLYCLAVVLGAFTHPTMGLMALAQFMIWGATLFGRTAQRAPCPWNGLFCGFIPVGLLTFQAYALVLPSMVGGALLNSGLQGRDNEWTNPLWAFAELVSSLRIGFASGGVVLVAGAVFAIGLLDFIRKRPAVASLFLIPVVVGFTVMTSIGYTLFPRFFFFAFGFAIIIVIRGATVTGRFLERFLPLPASAAGWLPALLCAGIVSASVLSLRHVYLPKQNYAAAIELIERETQPGDTVLTVGIAGFPFNAYYGKEWPTIETVEELERLGSETGRTWLIYTMPVHAKTTYPEILARIDKDFTVVDRFHGSLGGGDVVVCRENIDRGARAGTGRLVSKGSE
ncbi:hypothetical protein FGK63_12865 [Ruegeria sediminis]|uniref:Glycosyltransferase RgtA/B/C/D-like domain-containing protein n=1 Tax=Ruegeria sediminis TaxID=2583820 RepID=A0ABY2WW71_9RHOB|nr:glycosyltransferase family 39 protein [Ruegeria sediminis]TMV07001.1 hypothetical protein FGK63_12865 [Ruegeria sediminis]